MASFIRYSCCIRYSNTIYDKYSGKRKENEKRRPEKGERYAAPSGRWSRCAFIPGALPQARIGWTFSP
jgi:hypothetical protein